MNKINGSRTSVSWRSKTPQSPNRIYPRRERERERDAAFFEKEKEGGHSALGKNGEGARGRASHAHVSILEQTCRLSLSLFSIYIYLYLFSMTRPRDSVSFSDLGETIDRFPTYSSTGHVAFQHALDIVHTREPSAPVIHPTLKTPPKLAQNDAEGSPCISSTSTAVRLGPATRREGNIYPIWPRSRERRDKSRVKTRGDVRPKVDRVPARVRELSGSSQSDFSLTHSIDQNSKYWTLSETEGAAECSAPARYMEQFLKSYTDEMPSKNRLRFADDMEKCPGKPRNLWLYRKIYPLTVLTL